MTYTPVVTPDITGTVAGGVVPLTFTGPPSYNPTGVRFDVAIGGVPFMLTAAKDTPYIRQTAPIQKPQFDVSTQAGEQSLDQYWIRSQASWHRGAGIKFYEPGKPSNYGLWEPGAELITEDRFESSAGVDVWTRDQATLLYRTALTGASGGLAYVTTGKLADNTDVVFTNEAGVVKRRTAAGASTSYTGGTAPLTAVAVAGSKILAGHATGIDVGDANGSTMAALWTIASGATVVPYWVKGRIIASRGPSLYSLTLTPGGAIASTNIIHTHQDASWVWSSVTDGPAAIYAAGYSGARSTIYKFTLQDATTGTLPTLGQAYEVGVMPTGEQVLAIRSYLGGYLALGTNLGVRVALMDSNGNINYGPLVVETAHPVTSVEGHGSFIYAAVQEGIDGFTGAIRINLGQPLPHEDLRFAYATDAQTHDNGVPSSIAFFGTTDRVVLGVTGKGVYAQSATMLEATGYILGGRIRYKTVEKKAFRLADLRARIPAGSVALSALDENASEVNLITLGSNAADGASIGLTQPAGNHEYLSFRTTLTCSGDGLTGPTLDSLQIKALPAPKRQRLIQYPLNCGDREADGTGTKFGFRGYAWQRIQAMELAEENNVVLQCQDFTNGETFSATIEQSEFARTAPRAADGSGNFSGTLKVTLRKLA